MPTSTRFDAELGVIATSYVGDVDVDLLLATTRAAMQEAVQHKCWSFLTDCTRIGPGNSLFDLHDVVSKIVAQRPPPHARDAVLMALNSGLEDKFHFWETACQNRGLNSRIFTDRAEALRWLKE